MRDEVWKLRGGAEPDLRLPTADCRLKVTRIRNRFYDGTCLVTHAEYAVVVDAEQVARITRIGSGWICCEGRDDERFGLPVSPINLKAFRDVKRWALERWEISDAK